MEKIEGLINVIGRFGQELKQVKDLIGEIEKEVTVHVESLKSELANFKKGLSNGEAPKSTLADEEMQVRESLSRLKTEIQNIDESMQSSKSSLKTPIKRSISNVSLRTATSSTDDLFSIQSFVEEMNEPLPEEWWRADKVDDKEKIDWKKEYAQREELQKNLMIKEGWKRTMSTPENLKNALTMWTGKLTKWEDLQWGRTKNGKLMFNARFEKVEDRDRIFAMRKEILEEGSLIIGEALSYVERKERWKMLLMAERLKAEGRNVEFSNRQICVDGEWWKYRWETGWKKLQDNSLGSVKDL